MTTGLHGQAVIRVITLHNGVDTCWTGRTRPPIFGLGDTMRSVLHYLSLSQVKSWLYQALCYLISVQSSAALSPHLLSSCSTVNVISTNNRSVLQLCLAWSLECTDGSLHEPRLSISTVDSPRLARIRSSSNVSSPLSPSITPWLLHSWCITACFTNPFRSKLSSSLTQDFHGLSLGLDLLWWSIFVFFSVFTALAMLALQALY